MRHPRRGRNLALLVACLGVAAVGVAVWLTRMNRPGNVEVIVGVLGLKVAIVATVLAIISHVKVVRRHDRLLRGEGVLVRWRIDAARWQVYCDAETAWAREPHALPNALQLPGEIPTEGINVIISTDAFGVGPEFEPLEKNVVVRQHGPVLELQHRIALGRSGTRLVAYRLPAPENAEADIARLVAHFAAQAAHSRTAVRKVALVALVVALGALIWLVIWVTSVARRA